MGALFGAILDIVGLVVNLYLMVVVLQVVLHWLVHFKILRVENKYSSATVAFLEKVTQPVYKKVSEKIPPISGFDASPFIVILVLWFVCRLIYRLSIALM
jgi:YggT family protein